MDFLSKLKFFWKKPKIVIITGKGRKTAKEAVYRVLKQYFQVGKEILVFETDLENSTELKKLKFFLNNSSLAILMVTHIGDIPFDKEFFTGERGKTSEIKKLAKIFPSQGHLILNFDDETVREIKEETNLKELTFGFQSGADFRATDIKLNSGTNFKINYKGSIVPIWLEKSFDKEQIYTALSAAAVGVILDLNLIEISQALKSN